MAMRQELIDETLRLERPYKREAKMRNGQSTLIMILLATMFAFVVISVIAFIEIQVSRFNDPLIYNIVITAVVAVLVGIYLITVVVLRSLRLWPLHDADISENNSRQYGLLLFYVPLLTALIIALIWIGNWQTNGENRFQDIPGGVKYSWVAQGTWFMSLMCMFSIISSMFTFYRQRQPIYKFAVTQGVPWSRTLNEIVQPEYDSETNSMVLRPNNSSRS
jgi:hypothetical protein